MRTIAILMTTLALGTALVACSSSNKGGSATSTPSGASNTPGASATNIPMPPVAGAPTVTASGLKINDIKVGDGTEAKAGDTFTANYTGWLQDGTMFGTSIQHGGAVQFTLASGQPNSVIRGWQEGVPGMKVGGTRRLIIPPELAYGAKASGGIPANSTLTFDIELVSIP